MQESNNVHAILPVGYPPRDDAFPIYSGLWRSFYDRNFYNAVLYYWRRFWIYYLLLVVVATGLPSLALFRINLSLFMNNELPHILANFPTVEIRDGKASLPAGIAQPITIQSEKGAAVMVIDTTIDSRALPPSDIPLRLTQDRLMLNDGGHSVELIPFAPLQNIIIDAPALQEMTHLYNTWFLPFLIPIGLAVKCLTAMVQVALFAGFGYLTARLRGMVIPYAAMWRLSVAAITPAMVLQLVLVPILGNSELLGLIQIAVLFGYMWFALDAVYKATLQNIQR